MDPPADRYGRMVRAATNADLRFTSSTRSHSAIG